MLGILGRHLGFQATFLPLPGDVLPSHLSDIRPQGQCHPGQPTQVLPVPPCPVTQHRAERYLEPPCTFLYSSSFPVQDLSFVSSGPMSSFVTVSPPPLEWFLAHRRSQ